MKPGNPHICEGANSSCVFSSKMREKHRSLFRRERGCFIVRVYISFDYDIERGKSMIRIQNVSKTFTGAQDTVHALQNVNIHVEKGDIFGIVGLSGAGKSTLVRCINRLEEPTQGTILVGGKDVTKLTDKELRTMRKKIGMIFQHFNLLSCRTVAGNIAYPMEIDGVSSRDREERMKELLFLVELEDKMNVYPAQLSGGQKQRVGIARALANHPDVLLCDEATSALDPKTTKAILKLLKQINEKLGLTIVIITHEMEVIKEICTKVAVMEGGEVVEQGWVADVFANPTHDTTKSFVQTVTHEVPAEFFSHQDPTKELLRLSFKGSCAKQPILSQMIRKFDVDANILLGGVDHLQQMIVGNLVVELSGEPDKIVKAVEFLKDHQVQCEVLRL